MTTPQTKRRLAVLMAAVLLGGSAVCHTAFAGDDTAHDLGEDVITEQATQAPKADAVIDAEDINQKQASDLADVFSEEPDVSVGGGHPVAQKIYVRGLEDTNLNISIDGAAVPGYLYHHQGRVGIDPDLLKSVEVDSGTGDATAGPGAVGGAIRMTTKDVDDLLRGDQRFGGKLKGGYYTAGEGKNGSVSLYAKLAEELNVLFYGSLREADDYDDGHGETVPNTAYDQESLFFKIHGVVAGDHSYSISHERFGDTGRRPQRPHMVLFPTTVMDHESNRHTTAFNYGYNPDSDLIDLAFSAFYTEQELALSSPFAPFFTMPNVVKSTSWGGDLRNTSIIGQHSITYGTDLRVDHSESWVSGAGSKGDWEGSVFGLYVQDQFQVTDRLVLDFGLRVDSWKFEDDLHNDYDSVGLSPNASATFFFTEALSVHGGWARAHRGVRANEVLVLGLYKWDANIDPETADTFELGFDYDDNALSFGAEVYYTEIDDYIGIPGNFRFGNVGTLKTRGYSAYVGYTWSALTARLSMDHSMPELEGEPLSDANFAVGTASGRTWIATLDYRLPQYNIVLGWESKFVETLDDVPSGSRDKDSYHVHNAHATWQPLGTDQLELAIAVNNIFDEFYYDHASYGFGTPQNMMLGMPEPGIDGRFTISLKY